MLIFLLNLFHTYVVQIKILVSSCTLSRKIFWLMLLKYFSHGSNKYWLICALNHVGDSREYRSLTFMVAGGFWFWFGLFGLGCLGFWFFFCLCKMCFVPKMAYVACNIYYVFPLESYLFVKKLFWNYVKMTYRAIITKCYYSCQY